MIEPLVKLINLLALINLVEGKFPVEAVSQSVKVGALDDVAQKCDWDSRRRTF